MESPFNSLVLSDADLRALQTPEGIFGNFERVMILGARQEISDAIDQIVEDLDGWVIGIQNIDTGIIDYDGTYYGMQPLLPTQRRS